MLIISVLDRTFNILLIVYIIVLFVIKRKEIFSTNLDKQSQKKSKEKPYNTAFENYKEFITNSVLIIFLIMIIFIILKMKNWYWILIIFGIPVCLRLLVVTYQSIRIIRKVVSPKGNDKLSYKELTSLIVLAYVIYLFKVQNILSTIIDNISVYSNAYLSDILLAITYILIFSIYLFFICSLFAESLISTINIFKTIYANCPWKNSLKNCGDYWINKIGNTGNFKSILIYLWKHIGNKKQFTYWTKYLLIPITFLIDIIIELINVFFCEIISSIGCVCLLFRMINKSLNKLINWLLDLSDKKVISISFRISLIMALVCTVVFNRYQPIFRIQESSTAVLEFIASAIIIPIIFEWINSFKNNHVNNTEDSE